MINVGLQRRAKAECLDSRRLQRHTFSAGGNNKNFKNFRQRSQRLGECLWSLWKPWSTIFAIKRASLYDKRWRTHERCNDTFNFICHSLWMLHVLWCVLKVYLQRSSLKYSISKDVQTTLSAQIWIWVPPSWVRAAFRFLIILEKAFKLKEDFNTRLDSWTSQKLSTFQIASFHWIWSVVGF